MSLSEQEIEQLESILFAEHLNEEALDYFGFHGLVCSTIVVPVSPGDQTLISLIFGCDDLNLSAEDAGLITGAITQIKQSIMEDINEGSDIFLPYVDEAENENDYDACLESWCVGFMEGFFYQEETWFGKGEDIAAELLLPIMALSGLFDSDEFQEIRRNEKILSQFEEIMPEQLVDIFLFYHSD